MATKTVLEYVQGALDIMEGDEVDDISDTVESMQVAKQLAETYYELLNRQEWEFLKGPLTLTAAADVAFPTKFLVPSRLRHLHNLWYNKTGAQSTTELCYVEPVEFLRRCSVDGENRSLITLPSQLQWYVETDKHPTFYTTFDDQSIYCNSYDVSIESTLQASKVSAYGLANPDLTLDNDFVPTLPEHMVPLLTAALNAACSLNLKQVASPTDDRRERRQLAQARRTNSKIASRDDYYANKFGRR